MTITSGSDKYVITFDVIQSNETGWSFQPCEYKLQENIRDQGHL